MTESNSSSSGLALVLTADDALWDTTRSLLTGENFDARRIASVDDVANVADVDSPTLIIVDEVEGPDRSLELCAAIRRRPGLNVVPIIFYSSDVDGLAICDEDRYSNVGMTTALSKPVDLGALRNHVLSMGDTGRTLTGIRAFRQPGMTILECMPDAFFTVSGSGHVEEHLGGAAGDTTLAAAGLAQKSIADVWPQPVATAVIKSIRRALKSRDSATVEIALKDRDGESETRYEVRILVRGRDRVLMILRNLDLDAPVVGTASMERGRGESSLMSREEFVERLESTLMESKLRERGAAILCIDIDQFTRINETFGREVGDAVLTIASQRIERCRRGGDKLARVDDPELAGVTRISGDEFLLVLTNIDSREDIDSVASRIRTAFDQPLNVKGHTLNVMPSIGIAMYPLDGDDGETLLKNARIALDEAKITGAKGREFYTNTMKYRTVKRLDVKDELSWAIENDQLALRFLPRIDIATGKVAGLEALLRWIHPLRGSVPLTEVIPVAETSGLILPIGEWVIENTCRLAVEWADSGVDVPPVSVNLSRQEFTRDDLCEILSARLAAAGLEPNMLELEITEHLLLGNRRAEAIVRDLDQLGVGIVIDDFGRGHSSIANLTGLPIKAIKIDRSFIDGAIEDPQQRSVCAAIIAMSRELGITVIAEGVEEVSQLDFLRERGCDSVQGFLYTQPLPAAEVPDFLSLSQKVLSATGIVDLDAVRRRVAREQAT